MELSFDNFVPAGFLDPLLMWLMGLILSFIFGPAWLLAVSFLGPVWLILLPRKKAAFLSFLVFILAVISCL